jgi:hypothetical protein
VELVVREGVGAGGEMTQALYAHMNNETIKIKKKELRTIFHLGGRKVKFTLLGVTVGQQTLLPILKESTCRRRQQERGAESKRAVFVYLK